MRTVGPDSKGPSSTMEHSVTDLEMPRNQSSEKTAIFALTRKGAELAARISALMPGSTCFCNRRYALPPMTAFRKLSEVFPSVWRKYDSILCIMGCGIAVRMVAPLLKDKFTDPAVVVMDQDGRFAVSLLSGHIGGANDLARKAASITGGQAVITTASDLQDKPAVDLAAKKAGLRIENRRMLGRIEAAILDEEPLWIYDPGEMLLEHLPADHGLEVIGAGMDLETVRNGLGIWVSEALAPRGVKCLKLRPATLVVGVAATGGPHRRRLSHLLEKHLRSWGLRPLSIKNFTSLDIKSDEPDSWMPQRHSAGRFTFIPARNWRASTFRTRRKQLPGM